MRKDNGLRHGLRVNLSLEELSCIRIAARNSGLSISDLVLKCMTTGKKLPELKKLLDERE
jgi:hypothetical protein